MKYGLLGFIYRTSKLRHKKYKKICTKYKDVKSAKKRIKTYKKKEVLVVIKICQKMN